MLVSIFYVVCLVGTCNLNSSYWLKF